MSFASNRTGPTGPVHGPILPERPKLRPLLTIFDIRGNLNRRSGV